MSDLGRILFSVVLVGVLLVPGLGDAAVIVSGAVQGNSWARNVSQSVNETWLGNIVGPYDHIQAHWVSGATFEAPLFRNMSDGWSASPFGQTTTFSAANGPSVIFSFQVVFNDDAEESTFEYFVYHGTTLKQAQRGTVGLDGTSHFEDLQADQAPGRLDPIPEPGTLTLLGLGALGLFARAARRKKAS